MGDGCEEKDRFLDELRGLPKKHSIETLAALTQSFGKVKDLEQLRECCRKLLQRRAEVDLDQFHSRFEDVETCQGPEGTKILRDLSNGEWNFKVPAVEVFHLIGPKKLSIQRIKVVQGVVEGYPHIWEEFKAGVLESEKQRKTKKKTQQCLPGSLQLVWMLLLEEKGFPLPEGLRRTQRQTKKRRRPEPAEAREFKRSRTEPASIRNTATSPHIVDDSDDELLEGAINSNIASPLRENNTIPAGSCMRNSSASGPTLEEAHDKARPTIAPPSAGGRMESVLSEGSPLRGLSASASKNQTLDHAKPLSFDLIDLGSDDKTAQDVCTKRPANESTATIPLLSPDQGIITRFAKLVSSEVEIRSPWSPLLDQGEIKDRPVLIVEPDLGLVAVLDRERCNCRIFQKDTATKAEDMQKQLYLDGLVGETIAWKTTSVVDVTGGDDRARLGLCYCVLAVHALQNNPGSLDIRAPLYEAWNIAFQWAITDAPNSIGEDLEYLLAEVESPFKKDPGEARSMEEALRMWEEYDAELDKHIKSKKFLSCEILQIWRLFLSIGQLDKVVAKLKALETKIREAWRRMEGERKSLDSNVQVELSNREERVKREVAQCEDLCSQLELQLREAEQVKSQQRGVLGDVEKARLKWATRSVACGSRPTE